MMDRDLSMFGINTEKEAFFKGLCQWTSTDGVSFIPANKGVGKLLPGAYDIVPVGGQLSFKRIDAKIEELIRFPDANSDKVIDTS